MAMANPNDRSRSQPRTEAEHGPDQAVIAIVFTFMAVLALALELGFFNV